MVAVPYYHYSLLPITITEGSKEPIHLSLSGLRSSFLEPLRGSFLESFCRKGVFGLGDAVFCPKSNLAKAAFNFSKTSLVIQSNFSNFPS